MRQPTPFILAALVTSACGQASSAADGSSFVPMDAAMSSADSGLPDAATLEPTDASASEPPDASTAVGADASMTPPDSGGANLCAAAFAGCAAYDDFSAAGAQREVTFASLEYSPRCMKIAAGQSVTFTGSFSMHPLEQACGPASEIARTTSGTTGSFRFDTPGEYGYFCTRHGTATGTGMAGSVRVE